jgi:sec-independent protein translocase protein TatB
MFGLGLSELILIAIVALLVLKPEKLPEHVKTLGRLVADFKRAGAEVRSAVASIDSDGGAPGRASNLSHISGADEPITSISAPPAARPEKSGKDDEHA